MFPSEIWGRVERMLSRRARVAFRCASKDFLAVVLRYDCVAFSYILRSDKLLWSIKKMLIQSDIKRVGLVHEPFYSPDDTLMRMCQPCDGEDADQMWAFALYVYAQFPSLPGYMDVGIRTRHLSDALVLMNSTITNNLDATAWWETLQVAITHVSTLGADEKALRHLSLTLGAWLTRILRHNEYEIMEVQAMCYVNVLGEMIKLDIISTRDVLAVIDKSCFLAELPESDEEDEYGTVFASGLVDNITLEQRALLRAHADDRTVFTSLLHMLTDNIMSCHSFSTLVSLREVEVLADLLNVRRLGEVADCDGDAAVFFGGVSDATWGDLVWKACRLFPWRKCLQSAVEDLLEATMDVYHSHDHVSHRLHAHIWDEFNTSTTVPMLLPVLHAVCGLMATREIDDDYFTSHNYCDMPLEDYDYGTPPQLGDVPVAGRITKWLFKI